MLVPTLFKYTPENLHKQIVQRSAQAEQLLKNINQTQVDYQIFKMLLKEHKKDLKLYKSIKIDKINLLSNLLDDTIKKAITLYASRVEALVVKKQELKEMEGSNVQKRKQNKRLSLSMSDLPITPPIKSQKNPSEPNLQRTSKSSEEKHPTEEKKDNDDDEWVHATYENVQQETAHPPNSSYENMQQETAHPPNSSYENVQQETAHPPNSSSVWSFLWG